MRIQGGDRLIKEDDLWLTGHCPGDAHPLKLAAGELVNEPVLKGLQLHVGDGLVDDALILLVQMAA